MNFVTRPSIASFEPTDAVDLKGSLERFRELSGQLGESEGLLQAHVAELRDQLAEAGRSVATSSKRRSGSLNGCGTCWICFRAA